jgi:predicted chitinase
MTNTAPIQLEQLFRFWRGMPHQAAAVSELQQAFKQPGATYATVMRRDQGWFRTWSTDGKQADPELVTMAQATAVFIRQPSASQLADLNACLRRFNITTPARIRHFLAQCGHESGGLRWMLELASGTAYEGRTDLGNTHRGDGPRFKGAGAIQLTGRYNYQRFADAIGDPDVMDGAPYVATKYPFTSAGYWWQQNGMNALVDGGATVRKVSARVNGRDPANGLADREAYYARAMGQFPDQLQRPPLQQQPFGNPLQVPWYSQLDSADRAQAARMCFSSSNAMLLQYLKPGTLTGPNGDDQFLKRVQQYGDTTNPDAQIRALSSYGIRARFIKTCTFQQLEQQINRGVPVPCGFLHRGPVSKPSGGGHWLIVVGYTSTHLIVHDPFGEADLVTGATVGGVARFMQYSRKNFSPRWMVEGPGTGWAIIAER